MRLSIDAYERMAGEILKVYEQAELEMSRRVAKRLEKGVTQPGWTEQKYGEMKAVTKQMTKVVDSLHRDVNVQVQRYVETGYEDGKSSFINEASEFTDISQIRELTPNAVKVANIMGDLDMSLSAADRLILRQVNDQYANIIAQTSALVATGSFTNKQAVQIALNRFADKGISSFIDKAGRRWEMTTYAEMATLTAIERATRQGYTDTMQEFGFDLAIISSHYGACPLCEAWENVIISISGKDTRYPSLADAEAGGCFHPRCMHVFSTYYEGITKGGRKGPKAVTSPNIGYSARAQQRAYERSERRWKRRMAVAQSPEEERAAYARVRMYQERIRGLIAEYNALQDPSVDYLPRKYDREGGRVKLSADAAKIKPVVIPESQQAKPVDMLALTSKTLPGPKAEFFGLQSVSDTRQFQRAASGSARAFVHDYDIAKIWDSKQEIQGLYSYLDKTKGCTVEWADNGTIKQVRATKEAAKKMQALTDKLIDRMSEKDLEAAETYSQLQKFFRETPLYISEKDRADIPDFKAYARSDENFVRVSSDKSRFSIDSAYQALQEQFPGRFSPDITAPSDMLLQINDVMADLKYRRSIPLREVYSQEALQEVHDSVYYGLMQNYFIASDKAREAISGGRRK